MNLDKNVPQFDEYAQIIELTSLAKDKNRNKANKTKMRVGLIGATVVGLFASAALAQSDNSSNDRIVASLSTDVPVDALISTTSMVFEAPASPTPVTEILPDGTVVVTYPDGTIVTTLPDGTVITTPPPMDTTPTSAPTSSTDGPATTIPSTTVDTIPSTTTPETTLPPQPLLGLSVSINDNNETDHAAPGETITYSVSLTNPDDVVKEVSIRAGFIDSFALDRITSIRVNGCGSYNNDSGPLHVYLNGIRLDPNQTCQVEYDALVAFPDKSVTSNATIFDETTGEKINKRFATIYS